MPVARAGTSAVECAIVLPLVLTLTLGCTDYARVIHVDMVLTNSARVGADFAATHRFTQDSRSSWVARVEAIVREEASTIPGFDESNFSFDVTDTELGENVLVSVHCFYQFERAVNWPGLPKTTQLSHTVAMTQYQ